MRARGSAARIRRVASRPSSSGMRMSISTTVGLKRAACWTASRPLRASATTSMSGSRGEQHAEAGADHRLVVGDEHADHASLPGQRQAGGEPEAAAVRGAGGHLAAVELHALADADEPVAGRRRRRPPAPSSLTSMRSSSAA